MFAQPVPVSLLSDKTFLFNLKNRGFLDGSDRKLHDFSGSILWSYVIMVVMFGGLGGLFGVMGMREVLTRQQLEQQGVDTTAQVTSILHTTSTDSKGRKSNHYYLTYAYQVYLDNSDYPTRYSFKQNVSQSSYARLHNGDSIQIRYLRSDPSVSRYLFDTDDNGILPAAMSAPFVLVAVIIVIYGIRQKLRNNRLEADGQIIAGKITNIAGKRVKGGYTVTVSYSFRTPEGIELTRKESRNRNDLRSALPAEGSPVAVLYVHDKLFRIL